MKNLTQMMKQAQEMQAKMAELQARLEAIEVTGASGGGLVRVTATGKGAMRRLSIDPSLLKPEEAGVLEDLVVAASNDAKAKAEAKMQEETQKLLGGLQLPPGMKLPF
ncbi:MAG: YbaB/EbfC family nucleoid-associated protein [Rhodospirillales bacterium]